MILPKRVATEIAKDLIRLDKAEDIIIILEDRLEIETQKVLVHEEIVNNQLEIIGQLDRQIVALNEIIRVKDDQIAHWKKQYKKQKRQKFLIGGVGIALVVLMAL